MKKIFIKTISSLIAIIPVMTMVAMTVSANNIASPYMGQPKPPSSLKKYRMF